MEINKQHMDHLSDKLLHTLSTDKATRDAAESYLNSVSHHAGFPVLVLKMVEVTNGADVKSKSLRQSAAVLFKNTISKRWAPDEDSEKENSPIVDADRNVIKTILVNLMCHVPQIIQRQLSASITIISKTDFPDKWNSLLPELVSKFNTQDFNVINAVLETANAICKRFRNVPNTDENRYPLSIALKQFAEPLLQMFRMLRKMAAQHAANKAALECVFQALRTVTRIFYSLCWLDLPEYFEDNAKEWFEGFHHFLEYSNPLLEDAGEEYEADITLKLKKAILKNVNLYAGKYEEEFQPFFQKFAGSVWKLLTASGAQPKYDKLVTASMNFLSAVVVKQAHSSVFSGPGALESIIKTIIVPNVALREVDEELLEDNPVAYIRTDIEGSDTDTRRRAACDLVRALCRLFETSVTPLCMASISDLLQQYTSNTANWKAKDSAMNLFMALSIRAFTRQHGVTRLNDGIKHEGVMSFFTSYVIPEIQSGDINASPVLKADALKFTTTFRTQMTKAHYSSLFPMILKFLGSRHYVVHTYAANCIERFLVQKDRVEGQRPTLRFGRVALQPFLQQLLVSLFGILEQSMISGKPLENDYVMRCIMRVISVGGTDVAPYIETVLSKITAIVQKVCANPGHPKFNHYMFETLAVLVKNTCKAKPKSADAFQAALFPPFEFILKTDVVEFTPYVFQIMAQLLSANPAGITPPFAALLPKLIHPSQWERRGNVPALVALLQAYMKRGSSSIGNDQAIVSGILGVFQKLLASKATEVHALSLITSFVSEMNPASFANFLPEINRLLMMKLAAKKKSIKFPYVLLPFYGTFFGKYGASKTIGIIEGLRAGMFTMLVNQVWVSNVVKLTNPNHRRCCAIGMTALLCSTPEISPNGPQSALWGPILSALIQVLEGETGSGDIGEDVVGAEEIEYMSSAGFSKLSFAGSDKSIPFSDIPKDLKSYLAQKMAEFSKTCPGTVGNLIQKSLAVDQQNLLQIYIRNAGVLLS